MKKYDLAVIGGGFGLIFRELKLIRDELTRMGAMHVSHSICAERRASCPCMMKLDEIRQKLNI